MRVCPPPIYKARPAGLDFGDCLACATAKLSGEPLLFVGDDFPATDLDPA